MSDIKFKLETEEQRDRVEVLRNEMFKSSMIALKRTCLFKVEYPEFLGLENNVTHSASRPKYNFKKDKWDDITFTMYDLIHPSTTKSIMDGLTILKSKSDKTITIKIFVLDPSGITIEEWNIIGEIKEVDFGGLDYSENSLLNVKVIFKVKDAQLLF